MSSIINKEDKIWNLFLGYFNLIGVEAQEVGLDLYGTESKTVLAKDLTVAHLLDHVTCVLTDIKEQKEVIERAKYHLKPDTFIQRSPELPTPEKGQPNA